MSTQLTVAIVKGSGYLGHNDRSLSPRSKTQTWDPELSYKNKVFKNESLEHAYSFLFQPSLEKYNKKQKRKDRRIKNYLDHIERSKQEKPFYEFIVSIGNLKDVPKGSDLERDCQEILSQYVGSFQERNPNFYVVQAIMHNDEKGVPHVHLDVVPFSTGNKRGLETRNSFSGALSEMGFKGPDDFASWRDREQQVIVDLMAEKNLEYKPGTLRDKHLKIPEYKFMHEQARNLMRNKAKFNAVVQQRTAEMEEREAAAEFKDTLLEVREKDLAAQERKLLEKRDELRQEQVKLSREKIQLQQDRADLQSKTQTIDTQLTAKKSEIQKLDLQIQDKRILADAKKQEPDTIYRTPSDIQSMKDRDYEQYRQRNKLTKKTTDKFEIPDFAFLRERKEATEVAEKYAKLAWQEQKRADGLEKAIKNGQFRPNQELEKNLLDSERLKSALQSRLSAISEKEKELDAREKKIDQRASEVQKRESAVSSRESAVNMEMQARKEVPGLRKKVTDLEKENSTLRKKVDVLGRKLSLLRRDFLYFAHETAKKVGRKLRNIISIDSGFQENQPKLDEMMKGFSVVSDWETEKESIPKDSAGAIARRVGVENGLYLINRGLDPDNDEENAGKNLLDSLAFYQGRITEADRQDHRMNEPFPEDPEPEDRQKDDDYDFDFGF